MGVRGGGAPLAGEIEANFLEGEETFTPPRQPRRPLRHDCGWHDPAWLGGPLPQLESRALAEPGRGEKVSGTRPG